MNPVQIRIEAMDRIHKAAHEATQELLDNPTQAEDLELARHMNLIMAEILNTVRVGATQNRGAFGLLPLGLKTEVQAMSINEAQSRERAKIALREINDKENKKQRDTRIACTVCNACCIENAPCVLNHFCGENDHHECQDCYNLLST